jgi:hypothetical protein
MISPSADMNMVLQLNMGEGKSSVILPMVAVVHSNGCKFARVVVLKPLAAQMFQLLTQRLSGLANRRIFYLPFSRTATLSAHQVQQIHRLFEECMHVGGILLAQPEHILSFKLMGVDCLAHSNTRTSPEVADALMQTQEWLQKRTQDILDESDEILHVRNQLIYTVGRQEPLEGHSERWTTVQQVLGLVREEAPRVEREFPQGIDVQDCPSGSFPQIRILHPDAARFLESLVAERVMSGALANCSMCHLPSRVSEAVSRLITTRSAPLKEDAALLETHCKDTGLWNILLLLRGLLAHGVLAYVMQERRWRVDYGLDLGRSVLAVPYRAKDVPAPRAEFSHPDVTIALTCFSYYFQGLSQSKLDQCFALLRQQDNPPLIYQKWVRNLHIPVELRNLSGVNTTDPRQVKDYLFPLFHRNHAVVDFFLSEVVFPQAAKTFPAKLATSAWDLAETKGQITTGFSGTKDTSYLLPTSVIQADPVNQLSTNARVLLLLLLPENDHYRCIHQEGRLHSAQAFLELLVQERPAIRILLDVGAQMLDLQNLELSQLWLDLDRTAEAVVFFHDDELYVLTRDSTIEKLYTSPFRQQMEKCLVYLDDSHTRGTDLKLPRGSRAAVTLGPKVTKDRFIQG